MTCQMMVSFFNLGFTCVDEFYSLNAFYSINNFETSTNQFCCDQCFVGFLMVHQGVSFQLMQKVPDFSGITH
jgi:hypothetical protein